MEELPTDSTETRSLLEQAGSGNRRAFDRLFARHRSEVRQFIECRLEPKLRARLDPSDVVQETQLEVFQRLGDYLERRPMPFGVWLRKTAYQRLLMLRRQHVEAARRAVGREVALPDRSSCLLARQFLARGSTPSQQVSRRELAGRVRQAIAQLPETDREILFMRNFEEVPYEGIACILEIDPGAARKRHGQALLRLHKALGEAGLKESQL